MNWFHEHLTACLWLIWLEGAIGTYIWMLHADRNPKLSADEIAPPIIEVLIAIFWFLTVPMMLIGKAVSGVQDLVAKFKN